MLRLDDHLARRTGPLEKEASPGHSRLKAINRSCAEANPALLHSRLSSTEGHHLIQSRLQGLKGKDTTIDIIIGTQRVMGQNLLMVSAGPQGEYHGSLGQLTCVMKRLQCKASGKTPRICRRSCEANKHIVYE